MEVTCQLVNEGEFVVDTHTKKSMVVLMLQQRRVTVCLAFGPDLPYACLKYAVFVRPDVVSKVVAEIKCWSANDVLNWLVATAWLCQ